MKKSTLIIVTIILISTNACNSTAPTATPGLSNEDLAATVDAAVRATNAATANQATIVEASVNATTEAIQKQTASAPAEPAPTLAPTEAAPVPTQVPPQPTPDATTMSEEELAAAIDAAVAEALACTQDAATTTADATANGTVNADETTTIEIAWVDAEQALALAEALITLYADVYGEYAAETLALLLEMEKDLDEIIEITLLILTMLKDGSITTAEAIEQIEAALKAANINVEEIQAQAEDWLATLQAELENRATGALAVQATEIAANRLEAIQSAVQYAESVRAALADQYVSPQELSALAQASANASASLETYGGAQLQSLVGSIEALTAQLAMGQWPQAQINLGALESAIPNDPDSPSCLPPHLC